MLLSVSVSSFSIFCYLLTTVICKSIRISQCSTYSIISIGLHFIILYYTYSSTVSPSKGSLFVTPLLIKSHYTTLYRTHKCPHVARYFPPYVYIVYIVNICMYLVQCPTATKATYHGPKYSHTKQHKKHE